MKQIVVHPGTAHRDDFMAVCVLLATLDEVKVFRRDAVPGDLADLNTYVVDVGMEYDPLRHNFDHHQDSSLPCAFHLIMQHLGYHEDAMQMFQWYPFMSMMDVKGPHKAAAHLGVDSSVLFASSSPIEGHILARFSRIAELGPENLLYLLMQELGREFITMIGLKVARLERLKKEARVVDIKHLKAVTCQIEEQPKMSMELFLRSLDDARIAICITPSVRGEGWELLRLGDHSMVDFRLVANNPEIRFVHANGFVATTRTRIPQDQVLALAAGAVIDAESRSFGM